MAVTTVQKTGKFWKGLQALGCLGTIVAMAAILIAISLMADATVEQKMRFNGIMGTVLFVSVPVYLFGRVGAWWFHG
jgi:hypothetical protein